MATSRPIASMTVRVGIGDGDVLGDGMAEWRGCNGISFADNRDRFPPQPFGFPFAFDAALVRRELPRPHCWTTTIGDGWRSRLDGASRVYGDRIERRVERTSDDDGAGC